MKSGTMKMIFAATVFSGITIIINLCVIIGLFVEIGQFHSAALSQIHEFNTVADETWTIILISAPSSESREKRATDTNNCGCSAQPNTCPRGPVGPRGRPGAKGPDGFHGIPGPDAYRVTGQVGMHTFKGSCIKCAPGPPGLKGNDGQLGAGGAHGSFGRPGKSGANGLDGAPGIAGDVGVRGIDGADGLQGHPGRNGVRGRGEIGLPGRMGGRGNWGKQGRNGAMGITGTSGPMGPPGGAGSDGENGLDGETGAIGSIGNPGKNGEYCNCPKKEDSATVEQVATNERGYEQPQDVSIQKFVESSAIKMEAFEVPPLPSTLRYSDNVVIATTTEDPPLAVYGNNLAAAPAAQPALSVLNDEPTESTPSPSSSGAYDSTIEDTVAADSAISVYEGSERKISDGGEVSTTSAPPGFSPKSLETVKTAESGVRDGYEGSPTTSSPVVAHVKPVVQFTPVYHRGTGGGRTTPTTTTTIAPAVKFVRHVGGWSRRSVTVPPPKTVPGSKTHDAELRLARRIFGEARAV